MLDLKPIKERLAAATPGPWSEYCESGEWWIEGDECLIANSSSISASDTELISHAPADIAALVAEIEALRAELAAALARAERGTQ